MKKLMYLAFVSLSAVSSSAAGIETQVYAVNDPWTDTGVVLPMGGYVDISASGSWCGNVNGPLVWYGPEGTGNPAPGVFLVPGVSSAALVGRIDSGSAFLVGPGGRFDASSYGEDYSHPGKRTRVSLRDASCNPFALTPPETGNRSAELTDAKRQRA